MNKEYLGWLFVRAFGVFFAALSVAQLFGVGARVFYLTSMYRLLEVRSESAEAIGRQADPSRISMVENQIATAWFQFGFSLLEFFIYTSIAIYCLRGGKTLYRLLTSRLPTDPE